MNWSVIPAEYELPEQSDNRRRAWIPVVMVLAIICGATLALVASNGTFSPVSVPVGE